MAAFIMAGRLQAFSFIVLFSVLALFMPPLSLFSSAAIGLVTLRHGWQSGLLLALAGAVVLSLLTFLLEENINSGFLLGLTQWGPIVLIASILYKSASWRLTLQTVFMLAGSGVLLFHALVADEVIFWTDTLNKSIAPVLLDSNQPELDIEELIQTVAQWMTGVIAFVMSIIWILSLLLARHWQAQLYNPDGFGSEFREIRLGKTPAIILLSLIAIAVAARQQLATELLMCGVAVFIFQGISLVHALVKRLELHLIILIMLYALLFVLPVHIALLLAAFGIIDSFADFREKLIKK